MKSKKAKEFIEKETWHYVQDDVIKAVELAEQEILEKAIGAFCNSYPNGCVLDKHFRCIFDVKTDCDCFIEFINQLNK